MEHDKINCVFENRADNDQQQAFQGHYLNWSSTIEKNLKLEFLIEVKQYKNIVVAYY